MSCIVHDIHSLHADVCLYDQLGGVGSAAAIFPGTFRKNADGSYSGRLIGGPDRGQYTIQQPSVGIRLSYDFHIIGHNTQGTTDYFGRHQFFDFTLNRKYPSRYTLASTLQADFLDCSASSLLRRRRKCRYR